LQLSLIVALDLVVPTSGTALDFFYLRVDDRQYALPRKVRRPKLHPATRAQPKQTKYPATHESTENSTNNVSDHAVAALHHQSGKQSRDAPTVRNQITPLMKSPVKLLLGALEEQSLAVVKGFPSDGRCNDGWQAYLGVHEKKGHRFPEAIALPAIRCGPQSLT
jgi:hypothetical protein